MNEKGDTMKKLLSSMCVSLVLMGVVCITVAMLPMYRQKGKRERLAQILTGDWDDSEPTNYPLYGLNIHGHDGAFMTPPFRLKYQLCNEEA